MSEVKSASKKIIDGDILTPAELAGYLWLGYVNCIDKKGKLDICKRGEYLQTTVGFIKRDRRAIIEKCKEAVLSHRTAIGFDTKYLPRSVNQEAEIYNESLYGIGKALDSVLFDLEEEE